MNVNDAIRSLFPRGFINYLTYRALIDQARSGNVPSPRRKPDYSKPPILATDLFAIAATLLLRSGAYHHVAPDDLREGRTVFFSSQELKDLLRAGKKWRGEGADELPPPPLALRRFWKSLWANRREPVFVTRPGSAPMPTWWKSALALLVIADEAAKDIGFWAGRGKAAQTATIEAPAYLALEREEAIHTLSNADPDLVSVLPKSRTPAVGCTLRSLSQHLALLPPRGLARAYWLFPGVDPPSRKPAQMARPDEPFNILLVPVPFVIRSSAFKGRKAGDDWGWFHVEPEWAPRTVLDQSLADDPGLDRFAKFLLSLIDDAERDVGRVDAVVLPETALGWAAFDAVAARLNAETKVELFISGLFDLASVEGDTPRLRTGNFAAMAYFSSVAGGQRSYSKSVREKHHRWKLERSQIEGYALGSALDPNLNWWEAITIESRSLDVFALRGSASITALICEDLARHDPCQELIRAIGPNLVFALLMDGAQLRDRWSSRYATVLADDPGSSVLTFTSLGLIERTNDKGLLARSRKIGLWRDDSGGVVELTIPESAHGVCVSLQPTPFREFTLDGRVDDSAQSWRLVAIRPVKSDGKDNEGVKAILDGRWPD